MYNKEQIDAEFMKTHGFRKKGTAFFRVLASEILQVVKTEKGRGRAEIQFGVFSLYSELLPQWLRLYSAIPRYRLSWQTLGSVARSERPGRDNWDEGAT
mgnify:CR=1 FL=1